MSFKESSNYFGCMEGIVPFNLFNADCPALARKCGEAYSLRCAEHLNSLNDELLQTLMEATLAYLIDLLDEHEGEYDLPEDFNLDEDSQPEDVMNWLSPVLITFDKGILSDDDAPPAFSIKLSFSPVPDELIEWVVRDDMIVYVGEYSDISPWNDKIMNKKWNYINVI